MKHFFSYIILFLLMISYSSSDAQQIAQFRHHVFYEYYYSPAFAMNEESPDILINHRSQWAGFDGAPKTSSLAGKYKFRDDMASGIIISNDIIGAERLFSINISYAYHLKLINNWNIDFGIAWTFTQNSLDGTKIDLYHDNDRLAAENISGKTWKPDANTGLVLNNDKYYFGISVLQLFQSKYRFYDDKIGSVKSRRHFFITGRADIYAGDKSIIETRLLTEMAESTPLRLDLSALWNYKDRFISGVTYSLEESLSLNLGYKYKDFLIIYSYDIILNRIKSASNGTNEITLGYFLNFNKTQKLHPSF